jgi:hypothetical protein
MLTKEDLSISSPCLRASVSPWWMFFCYTYQFSLPALEVKFG